MPDARLQSLLARMCGRADEATGTPIISLLPWLDETAEPLARVTAAFLTVAAGPDHPDHVRGQAILHGDLVPEARELAAFYRQGLTQMDEELAALDPDVLARLEEAEHRLAQAASVDAATEAMWLAFFPQAVGIRGHEQERIRALRDRRTITIEALAPDPITRPGTEILFTSNVLLTVPDPSTDIDALPYSGELRTAIRAAVAEPQRYWFDHPIQIGVEPAANELLYGLRGLAAAVAAEPGGGHITCLLSVSVTHEGLTPIARDYVEAELERDGALEHVDVVVLTEADTQRLVTEALVPALDEGDDAARASRLERVFGVDGAYGRHYSVLKAIAALWSVAVDPQVRATFKIDLDQVFPQAELLAQSGQTAFGHLRSPLWGARARAADGSPVELGLVAGALVNEKDIHKGLFTPDVPLPFKRPGADEHVFFSVLPQAISTRAEMMERYDGSGPDGVHQALERVHVTGGTNGIRVDALRRHRPFTPSWVGRAEDQAYLLSVLDGRSPRLGYAHAAGLIMRHDKEAFAGQAMEAARIGKLIGDDVRILVFSAYVEALARDGADAAAIRALLDPFTGGFVSDLPRTLVLLRLALRTLRLFGSGADDDAAEYALDGSARIGAAFTRQGDPAAVGEALLLERAAWDDYYDAVDALESDQPELRARATEILEDCRVHAV